MLKLKTYIKPSQLESKLNWFKII